MLKSLWRLITHKEGFGVKAAALLLALSGLLSNVLGLLRNLIFFRVLSPGTLDIYFASFKLPDLIFNLLIVGSISFAFVPVLCEFKDDHPRAWRLSSELISWIITAFTLLGLVLFICMPVLMHVIAPGFSPDKLATSIHLSRILLVQSVLMAVSFTLGGMLTAFQRFRSYALAPLLYNLALIGGGLLAARYGVLVLGWAVVLGAVLHVSVQLFEVRRQLHFRFTWDLQRTPELQRVLRLMGPRNLTQGINQISPLVFTSLASLAAGSITIMSGMNDLQTTPTVIIANSIALAFFPKLTDLTFAKEYGQVNEFLRKAVRTTLFLIIPTVALGLILRAQVVRLYFGIGGYSWELTQMAIKTFAWFMIGVVPSALLIILSRVFSALQDAWAPMRLALVGLVVGVTAAWINVHTFNLGVAGIVMGITLAAWCQLLWGVWDLSHRHPVHLPLHETLAAIIKYSWGGIVMAYGAWITLRAVDTFYMQTNWLSTHMVSGLLLQLLAASGVGVLLYIGFSKLFHPEEFAWLRASALFKQK